MIRRAQGGPRKNEIYTTFKKSRERVFRDKRSGDNENQGQDSVGLQSYLQNSVLQNSEIFL